MDYWKWLHNSMKEEVPFLVLLLIYIVGIPLVIIYMLAYLMTIAFGLNVISVIVPVTIIGFVVTYLYYAMRKINYFKEVFHFDDEEK